MINSADKIIWNIDEKSIKKSIKIDGKSINFVDCRLDGFPNHVCDRMAKNWCWLSNFWSIGLDWHPWAYKIYRKKILNHDNGSKNGQHNLSYILKLNEIFFLFVCLFVQSWLRNFFGAMQIQYLLMVILTSVLRLGKHEEPVQKHRFDSTYI